MDEAEQAAAVALERQYPIVLCGGFALLARQSLATAAVVRGRRGGGRNAHPRRALRGGEVDEALRERRATAERQSQTSPCGVRFSLPH